MMPERPNYRLIVDRGTWNPASGVALHVMILAVPRRRNAGYALLKSVHDGDDWTVVRVDWETLIVWELATPMTPPAAVTPINPESAHGQTS